MVGGISEVTPQAYDAHFDLNMKGAFFTTQAALQRMPGPGRIINISSVAARSARPHVIAYAATKGAMNSFTLALAVEVAPRQITVNAVAPGFVKTDLSEKLLTPERMREAVSRVALGRIGAPPDIAAIVSFLASDASGWVTGQVIDASGGTSLS